MKRASAAYREARPPGSRGLALLPGTLLVLVVYVWLVSAGTWTDWQAGSSYYDQLSEGFRSGHLWLNAKPDPALLALPNPYDPAARAGLSYIPDASLYQGRYYLYFGPTPAIILLPLKVLLPATIGDKYLVFLFTGGVALLLTMLAWKLWRRSYTRVPSWVAAAGVAGVCLISPFGWILGSKAAVHDAAISAGQFFFLGGLYAAFAALDRARGGERIAVVSGVLWAAAVGSRLTQIVPVLFTLALITLHVLRRADASRSGWVRARCVLAFAAPLAVGMVALGWYNWSRFGSVLETGITYQLALLYLQANRSEIFSAKYLVENLYNYLLMPPKLRYNFPYIWPRMGIRQPIVPGQDLPSLYFAEEITGLVFTAPFLILAFVPVLRRLFLRPGTPEAESNEGQVRWLEVALTGSMVSSLGLFLVFFWASERYLMDFLPSGLLLGLMGFWQLAQASVDRRLIRIAAIGLGLMLLVASVVVSNLLAIALNADAFKALDPVIWQQLNNLFRP